MSMFVRLASERTELGRPISSRYFHTAKEHDRSPLPVTKETPETESSTNGERMEHNAATRHFQSLDPKFFLERLFKDFS
jgi:hypothetical protein